MSNPLSPPLIQAHGVHKAFNGFSKTIDVLRGVDVHISAGETVSIRGESGCGKTTLLNVLSHLESPDQGSLFWEGHDIRKTRPDTVARLRARLIGFIFQAFYLAPEMDALENVLLAARILGRVNASVRRRARSLIDRVGLSDRERHLPTQLSGGERQRVAIARALINVPKLILADEPTGNLDETTGLDIMNLLLTLCREQHASLVLVTHNPSFAARTDRQLYLCLGQLDNKALETHIP